MGYSKHRWTPKQDELVRAASRGEMSTSWCAERCGVTRGSVFYRAAVLGVPMRGGRRRADSSKRNWTAPQDNLIRQHSEDPETLPLAVLATRLGCARPTIYRRAQELGLRVHRSARGPRADSGSNYGGTLVQCPSVSVEIITPPITVGSDRLLERLRRFHPEHGRAA